MVARITITTNEYENRRRQAAAWRLAIGVSGRGVIFNAISHNDGAGVSAAVLTQKLRAVISVD